MEFVYLLALVNLVMKYDTEKATQSPKITLYQVSLNKYLVTLKVKALGLASS